MSDLQQADRKRLPGYPVPAIRMGRLGVSASEQGKGHGEYLVGHAVARCLALRRQLGLRVLLVDALHERAPRFYRAYGFRQATANPHTLYLPLGNSGEPGRCRTSSRSAPLRITIRRGNRAAALDFLAGDPS